MDSNNKRSNKRRYTGKKDFRPRNSNNSDAQNRGDKTLNLSDLSRQQLEDKIKDLEGQIEDFKNKVVSSVGSVKDNPSQTLQITTSTLISSNAKVPPKFEALMSRDFTAVSKEDSTIKVNLCEKDIVDNEIILGDTLLIETHKDLNIKSVKVAQRAKRCEVDSLVIQKEDKFYAVSKFATHKLLNYEVLAKAILKGFDVTLILPEGSEKESYYALIKFVEGASAIEDSVYSPSYKKPDFDPRVIEEDDLV